MIDPQEILTTYNTLIKGPSTKAIKQAEQRLKQLCDAPVFLDINKAILLEDQLSISIKKMSAVHLAIFLKKNKRNNNVAVEVIAKSYLELLCHEKMEYSLKALLLSQLQELLSDDANQGIRTALMNKLIQDLSTNVVNYQEVVYIGHALLGLKATPKNTKTFIIGTFEKYNVLTCQLHAEVSKVTDKKTLISLLRIITDYSKLIQLFIARIGLMDVETSKLFYSPQLAQSVRTAFQLTIPGNQFNFHLYFSIPQQSEITSLLNAIKKNYISVLGAFLRILKGITKNPQNLLTNVLYVQSSLIIDYCIQSTADLLQNRMYYQLSKNSQLVPSLFQALGLMITALRNNDFYETFRKYRTELLQKVLIHCLCFSPGDVQEFYQNHTQFVQKVLQIVDKEVNSNHHQKRKAKDDEEIQMFDTLKTYAGDCISVLCKFQDEVLAEIFEFSMNVLQGKIGCPYPKSVFLMLITLLKPRLTKRKDFQARLGLFLVSVLKETQPPTVSEDKRKEQDLQYALLLLAVSRFAPDFGDLNVEILPISFQRGMSILASQGNEIYKTLIFELFDQINRLENGQEYALNLLQLYNGLIVKEPSNRLLDSYYQLFQFNLEYFQAYCSIVMEGICILCKHVQQQLKKTHPNQLFLNKCCNVIREIGQSQLYLPKVIPELQKAVLPWLSYIDGREGIDLQQDILLMLTAFLYHGKNVTPAQQEMFSIIPRVFYSTYHCTFGQAFTTVHSFIYYGTSTLANAPQAIQAIIEISIANMNTKQYSTRTLSEIDNCEGVLVLQSLVLACGSFLTKDLWIVLLQKIVQKLNTPIKNIHLIANLIGLLSLSLVQTQNTFTNEENLAILGHVLGGACKCSKVVWANKVIIAGLAQLMTYLDKDFIKVNFPIIFETLLILLEGSTVKLGLAKEAIIDSLDDNQDAFQYDNLIEMTTNNLKKLDEFTFFKQQFAKLHANYKDFLMEVVEKLPPILKDFLNRVLSSQKVENETRNIFKIKRGTS